MQRLIKRNKAFLSARLRECGYKRFYGERQFVTFPAFRGFGRPLKYNNDQWIPKSLWRYY